MKVRDFISEQDQRKVVRTIEEAELETSGEIRVHLESACSGDPVNRAGEVFRSIGMDKTALRNGVLIYVAVNSHTFAIVGDAGIDEKVPDGFWDGISARMAADFRQGRFTEGICTAVRSAGLSLKQYFPYQSDDVNEQSDEISFGE